MIAPDAMPAALVANPLLSQWIAVDDRGVTIRTGKVELGQGAVTGIAALAAEQLALAPGDLRVVAGDTRQGPDEAYTVGSMSIEDGGGAMRWAAALARELFVKAAAAHFDVGADVIRLDAGRFSVATGNESVGYAELRSAVDLAIRCDSLPRPQFLTATGGAPIQRLDFAAKLCGAAFLQDIDFDGLCFGRVLRPEHPRHRLVDIDRDACHGIPGILAVVIDGGFVGVVAERLELAARAIERLRRSATWRIETPIEAADADRWIAAAVPVETFDVVKEAPGDEPPDVTVEASFSRPYLAHASIGPSAAIAMWQDERVRVVSHSQGVFPLRSALARALRIPLDAVDVEHAMGAGCYGHNGADDVALDAALLARASGRPVMCAMSRQDELCWSPFGAAMRTDVRAAMSAQGRITGWTCQIFSAPHVARPGPPERGINLRAAVEIADAHPADRPQQLPGPAGSGDRNGIPIYDVGARDITFHLLPHGPLRSSSMRSLGAHCNVLAIESVMDDLAERAGIDPIAFRCNHLSDPRAIAVLQRVAEIAAWNGPLPVGEGVGRGVGFARYKNRNGYCAIVADITVEEDVRVQHVYAAVDCGFAVHPDGVVNQIEGGIVQAISWTLKEAVSWNDDGFVNRTWEQYPILGFRECPAIDVVLVDRPDDPPLGVGECVTGPMAAAIANAVANALSVRIRDLPITRDRVIAAMNAADS